MNNHFNPAFVPLHIKLALEVAPLIVSPGRKNPLPSRSLYAILNTLRFSFSTYPPSFRAAPVGTALSDPAPIAVVTCVINV